MAAGCVVTTSSARPDRLRTFARAVEADRLQVAHALDDVGVASATFAASSADAGAPPATGRLHAQLATSQAGDLARAVVGVASAFEEADRGSSPLVRTTDLRLAKAIARTRPGLSTGALAQPIDRERARLVGVDLRTASTSSAGELLRRLGSLDGLDPQAAAALLRALGPDGLSRLVRHSDCDQREMTVGPPARHRLLDALAVLLGTASRTTAPIHRPDDQFRTEPGGLPLAFIATLGRSRTGRHALRSVLDRHPHLGTGVTVAVAEALVLGPTAGDDAIASHARGPLPGEPSDVAQAELAVLRLLAADPMASMALETRHPTGASPTLTLLRASRSDAELTAVAAVIDHVANASVARGWATSWADDPEPVGLPARVLDRLVIEAIRADDAVAVPGPLSRVLAVTVARHPGMLDAATTYHERYRNPAGPDREQLSRVERFHEVLARDLDALAATTQALADRQAVLVRRQLAAEPPVARLHGPGSPVGPGGRVTVAADALSHRDLRGIFDSGAGLDALALGADAAGRHADQARVLGIQAVTFAASKLLPRAGEAVPVVGPVVGWGVKLGTGPLTKDAERRWSHPDDRREDVVVAAVRPEAHLVAVTMAADRRWSAVLVYPTAPGRRTVGVDGPEALAELAVATSARDRRRFTTWVAAQPAEVRSVLMGLGGGRPDQD